MTEADQRFEGLQKNLEVQLSESVQLIIIQGREFPCAVPAPSKNRVPFRVLPSVKDEPGLFSGVVGVLKMPQGS